MSTNASELARIQQSAGIKSAIRHQLFIGGKFVDAADGATLTSVNPHDNSAIADVAMAGREDIDRAVAAAQAAFPAWSHLSGSERGRILLRLADKIEQNLDELARLEALDTGHPLRDARIKRMIADESVEMRRRGLCDFDMIAADAAGNSPRHQQHEQAENRRCDRARDAGEAVPVSLCGRYLRHVSADDIAKFQIAPTTTPATPATHQRSSCPAIHVPMPILATAPSAEIA